MKIPEVTKEMPFIEFLFNEKGKLELNISNVWWGGKRGGFYRYRGRGEGNTCLPKDLESYIKSFKSRKIKEIEKEIQKLQKQLEIWKK